MKALKIFATLTGLAFGGNLKSCNFEVTQATKNISLAQAFLKNIDIPTAIIYIKIARANSITATVFCRGITDADGRDMGLVAENGINDLNQALRDLE